MLRSAVGLKLCPRGVVVSTALPTAESDRIRNHVNRADTHIGGMLRRALRKKLHDGGHATGHLSSTCKVPDENTMAQGTARALHDDSIDADQRLYLQR
jgi:hypothetical protein